MSESSEKMNIVYIEDTAEDIVKHERRRAAEMLRAGAASLVWPLGVRPLLEELAELADRIENGE